MCQRAIDTERFGDDLCVFRSELVFRHTEMVGQCVRTSRDYLADKIEMGAYFKDFSELLALSASAMALMPVAS